MLMARTYAAAAAAAEAPAGVPQPPLPSVRPTAWTEGAPTQQRYPPLTRDLRAHVAIIGGGVAGLSTALRLAKAGRRVVVLEAFACGAGQSGRSLGQVSAWHDGTWRAVERAVGNERARMAAQAHAAAVAHVEATVREEGIACGFRSVPSYVCAGSDRATYEEFCACSRIGIQGAALQHRSCGASLAPDGHLSQALVLPGSASLNPAQYIRGLADAVVRAGGVIFEGTRAKGGLITGPHQGLVQTFNGPTVQARDAVVLATGSPINRDQLWVHDRQLPKRLYTVGLEVPVGSIEDAHCHVLAGGGHAYKLRLAPLPGTEDTEALLVQRCMHHHGQEAHRYGDPYGELERWARKRFPQCVRVIHRWSSTDYYPADILGLYGQDPLDRESQPNCIMTGHGGQDITSATIGSEVVASAILGLPNPHAAAYNPSRVLPGATLKYVSELATYFTTVGLSLAKHVVPRSLSDLAGLVQPSSVQLARGEGMVVQQGWRKHALYKDAEGVLHRHSALCTHLGCCVEWNGVDRSFDCPCHGSSFSPACGTCTHGPAVADLEDLGGPSKQQAK